MSELPADILAEILIRVPAEPLFRARGICKAWRNIIDNPSFCKLHVHHHRGCRVEDEELIVCRSYKLSLQYLANCIEEDPAKSRTCFKAKHMPAFEDCPSFKSKPVINDNESYFMASSEGLDLLTNTFTRLALYNRLTREFLELPCPRQLPRWSAGLGYDSATDDYKVVIHSDVPYKGERSCRTMVYSLNSDAWRTVDTPSPRYHLSLYVHSVSFDGKLYWLENKKINESLVVLDLSTETYSLLPLPPIRPQDPFFGNPWQFNAMGGCLFLSYLRKTSSLDGWILCGADKSSWTKLFTFSDFVRYGIHINDLYLVPKAYLKSKGLVLIKMGSKEYIWLDTKKKTSKRFRIEGPWKNFLSRSFYQPSIVRLNGSGRGDRFQVIPTKQRKSDLELSLIRH